MTYTPDARPTHSRRLLAEFLGTALLVAVVVGSGIMASRLSPDPGVELLANSFATALGIAVLILCLGPVSGAHFNPLVSFADAVMSRGAGMSLREATGYSLAQVAGAISGALLSNAMFGAPAVISATERVTWGTLLGEIVATAGLLVVILGLTRTGRPQVVAVAVGGYIGAAYWFTSSTSFANPAVTVGRIFSDTFAGIAPLSALAFIAAQILGSVIGIAIAVALFPRSRPIDTQLVASNAPSQRGTRRPPEGG